MKLLVCGAFGYVGSRLLERARPDFVTLASSSSGIKGALHLDLANPQNFDFGRLDADDVVVITAAISSPDICANENARARQVNVTGTCRLTDLAMQRNARVIFLSSDTVYGQQERPCDETGPCQPAGDYAQMKHEVETVFVNEPAFKALRLSYVFSSSDKFTRYLCHCHAQGTEAEIFEPFVRSIVHRDDVVDGILALARDWNRHPQGVFNFGGPQALSRVDYAQILQAMVWPKLRWRVVTPDETFFANRPKIINMTSPWLGRLLGRPPSTLQQAALLEFASP